MKHTQKIITGENDKCQYKFEIGFTHFQGQAPYFSITGETWELGKPKTDRYSFSCGALRIGDYVPELAHLDKYHLVSTKEPMHYVANSLYHAKDNNLEFARASSVWPEAQLEDFTEEKLKARLPKLMEQFHNDIVAAGIKWPGE